MQSWVNSFINVRSADEDVQRRGHLLIIITLGVIALAIGFILLVVTTSYRASTLVSLALSITVFTGVIFMARAGLVDLGAFTLIGICLAVITLSIPNRGTLTNTPFYMVIVVVLAGVLLRPAQIWIVLGLALLGVSLGFSLIPAAGRDDTLWLQAAVGVPLLLLLVALISFLSARGMAQALAASRRASAEAEAASRALTASNAELEARVEERTAALRQNAEEQRAVAERLEASLRTQQDLNRIVAELSVPIIPISAGTLVVPLVGNIDSARANQLLDAVLAQLETRGARTVVLDVTGVVVVDTQVAAALLRVAGAARLMGAEAMLVGIRPEVAQALVHLGVELTELRTAATLEEGLLTLRSTRQR